MSIVGRRMAPALCALVAALALPVGVSSHVVAAPLLQDTAPPPPPPPPPADGPRAGQDDRTAPPPPPAAPPPGAARARSRPAQARPVLAPGEGAYTSRGVNIRVDATVTELRGDQVLGKKVVTVTVVDGERGQVRSTQQVPYRTKGSNGFNYQAAPLNMDAQALLRGDGRVRVSLTLDYRGGPSEGTDTETLDQGIRQSVTVVLESGTPLIVAQSADAVGDRRVTLELKATILK